jgi:hypothetical protein
MQTLFLVSSSDFVSFLLSCCLVVLLFVLLFFCSFVLLFVLMAHQHYTHDTHDTHDNSSPLQGVIFDLATLLNVTPADSGDAPMEGNIVSDSHWNVGRGARNMLMYLESRGLRVGLLPRILVNNKKLIDGTIEIFEQRMDYSFLYQAENSVQPKTLETNLSETVSKMSLDPQNVMVVSMSEQVIQTAKTMNMYTCAKSLGGKNWKATSAALQQIKEMEDLKAHVEELNGITYRL